MKNVKYLLKFNLSNVKDNTDSIFQFLNNEQDLNNWFASTIIDELGVDKGKYILLSKKEKYDYIYKKVVTIYNKEIDKLNSIIKIFQNKWDEYNNEINQIFSEIFDIQFSDEKECVVNVTLNPVCPRYLDSKSFDVNYKVDNILGICIHELLHFYWFDYWDKNLYKLKPNEKETPSTTWEFSEIAIDQLVNCTPLKKYFNRTDVAYDYFYDIECNGGKLVMVLRDMFNKLGLKEFMLQGLQLLNSDEIKKQLC